MQQTDRPIYQGFKDALPVLLGFIPFGLVLGAQGSANHMVVWQVPLMTGMNFAGGSEFAAIGLWASPPPLLLIMFTTFLINCRHILMSAALTPYLKGLPLHKCLLVLFLMCDECWALALNHIKQNSLRQLNLRYYFSMAISLYLAWIISTGLGALLGPVLGDIKQYGFDMAFVAVFLVLLKGMWTGIRPAFAWIVSLVVAAISYKLFEGAWYVLFGTLSGLITAYFLEKHK
ncbi:AzlC family ABC transporter permease [Gallibacterium salpingitidis]|uniref:AzlC family ABC transporter permease n=1 Tax=Gallibacterium salpingitidis TaxID=505341 RepID=UPI00266F133C|nr:AzlC family ABC transporter permease [Gallibacterium salpingitidis]WKS99896.1 AzlC family ABC transporter permease [Gallibacterium salpingitidis]